ncbi:hypothetical protein J2Z32_002072 [Paenibacillus turicensis]|uniref:Uncharacterized protein n=1 Tax=Paenibacillus turicensis TaxID=160487 RepID=A0ABS4FSA2_9BACL|nr:hypothetical protein [Paenibacillus turicensis]MBP1905442.1 hypothetical protein [Paenibacillus turicensis]
MEYFKLGLDPRIESMGGNLKLPAHLIQSYDKTENGEVVTIQNEELFRYPCLIEQPVLLVSDQIRRVLCECIPELEYKIITIFNAKQGTRQEYAYCQFQQVLGGIIKQEDTLLVQLHEHHSQLPNLLCVKHYHQSILISNLDVAERLLKVQIFGLHIEKVHLEEGINNDGTTK